jgi:excisionase family DNA binding protein
MLTTTEAADFLGVSRPYLARLLKSGRIPYRKKGNRHLVPIGALHEFKARRDRQLDELDRLAAAAEDLGLRWATPTTSSRYSLRTCCTHSGFTWCDADTGRDGYHEPRWSHQIIDEMRRSDLADHPSIDPRRFDDITIAALRAAFQRA